MVNLSATLVNILPVCTPAILVDGEWTYVDLELDPFLHADGGVGVHDQDEFVAACKSQLSSDLAAREARAAADEVEDALRDRKEPVATIGWNRLADAKLLSLPPLQTLRHVSTA